MVRRRCLRTILTGHTCSVVAPKLSYSVAPNWIAFCCPFPCELQAFTCPLKDAKGPNLEEILHLDFSAGSTNRTI